MFVKIKGTGSCLPEKVLDNFEISQLVDTNDEWIQSRTGIKSRHIAREEMRSLRATWKASAPGT